YPAPKQNSEEIADGFITGFVENCQFILIVGTSSQDLVRLSSIVKVCDGRLHTVFFKRKESEIILFVDDHFVAKGSLTQNKTIGNREWSQLFLGGLGTIKAPKEELSVYTPFTGCISDLHFNYKRLILVPQRLDKATLGVCVNPANEILLFSNDGYLADRNIDQYDQDVSELDANIDSNPDENLDDLMMAESPSMKNLDEKRDEKHSNKVNMLKSQQYKTCNDQPQQNRIIDGAFYFGATSHTYSNPRLSYKRHEKYLTFSTSLSFRTWLSNGTILAWTSEKLKSFLRIVLKDGRLILITKFRRTGSHRSFVISEWNLGDRLFNDSVWHSIKVKKRGKFLDVRIDNDDTHSNILWPLKLNLKQEKSGLTIGGVKKSVSKKFDTPPYFVGCVKDLFVDGLKYDLKERFRGRLFTCYENIVKNSVKLLSQNSSIVINLISSRPKIISFAFRFENFPTSGKIVTFSNERNSLDLEFFVLKDVINRQSRSFSHENWCRDEYVEFSFEFTMSNLYVNIGQARRFEIVGNDCNFRKVTIGAVEDSMGVVGCMKTLQIDGHGIDFSTESNESKNVAINECYS
uniref:Laminin G domain-containing protein n=1 Tax=Romanomermis culicivorax TaxID=13658 RepID=A0A915K492_ROMCU